MVANKTLYQDTDQNAIRRSAVHQFEGALMFNGFAAKFVLSGTEHYYIQDEYYEVAAGHYIVGNTQTPSESSIKSEQAVQGLCVDVSASLLAEVMDEHWQEPTAFKSYVLGEQFMVNQYAADQTRLGQCLLQVQQHLLTTSSPQFDQELFYHLAEAIVHDQYSLFEQRERLTFKKTPTKNHIFKQLLQAKSYLDEQWRTPQNLEVLAQQACLSKYRFIRLFKSVFKKTPYQYLIHKRLQEAYKMLQQGAAVQEVAFEVGFSDAFAFSKAFKAAYGCAPSKVTKHS